MPRPPRLVPTSTRQSGIALSALAALVLTTGAVPALEAAELRSPDGRIVVTVGVKERLEPYPSGPRLYYSVAFRGKAILLDSPLGLDFADAPPLARGLVVEKETPAQLRHDLGARRGQEPTGARPRQRAHARPARGGRPGPAAAGRVPRLRRRRGLPLRPARAAGARRLPAGRGADGVPLRGRTTPPGPRPTAASVSHQEEEFDRDDAGRDHAGVDHRPAAAGAGRRRTPSSPSPSPTCATGRGCTSPATAPRRTRSSRPSRPGRTTRRWRSWRRRRTARPGASS